MSEPAAARRAALYVLGRCRRFDAWSPQTLQAAAEKFTLDGRDMALCTRICRGVLQNAALCDFYIDAYCSVPLRKIQPQVLDILRMSAVQLLFLDRVPASGAVNEAVELTRLTAPRAAGMVNAVLRRLSEHREALPDIPGRGTAAYLATRYSHPLWLCRHAVETWGYEFAESWLAANNTEPPLTLTANPLRGEAGALSLSYAGGGAVQELDGYAQGRFFVQDAAAAESVRAIGLRPGLRVLDGCAAPGGKSFMAAILMENRGELLACDLHEKKLALIERGAERLGIDIIRTLPMDASQPFAQFAESFDVVMADVPCSGLGVIRRKPEIRYKPEEELTRLPALQGRILAGLSRCVKPGGLLHYSTCTVLTRENAGVVSDFLAAHPDFSREDERSFWPQSDGTDGFYYCRMRRHG